MRVDFERQLVFALADTVDKRSRAAGIIDDALSREALQIGLTLFLPHAAHDAGNEEDGADFGIRAPGD